jgi:hypothetical protein
MPTNNHFLEFLLTSAFFGGFDARHDIILLDLHKSKQNYYLDSFSKILPIIVLLL